MGFKKSRVAKKVIVYLGLFLVCSFVLIPFLWMVSTSFKHRSEIFTYPPVWIPQQPTLEGYIGLFREKPFGGVGFGTFLKNSLIVSLFTAAITVILASLASYSLSRFRFRGSSFLKYMILFSQMLPGSLMLIPLYLMMRDLKLLDNLMGLVFAYSSFTLPYCTYLLKGYFDSIPPDIDEAALIDGCSRIGALFHVVFPLAAPGFVVTITQAIIMSWNEFMYALTFINMYENWTVPLMLASFRGQYLVNWGYLFAGSTLVTIPVILIFLLLQKNIAKGFVAGAVKG